MARMRAPRLPTLAGAALLAFTLAAAPARAGETVAFQANAQHSGEVATDSLTPPLRIRWVYDLGGNQQAPPLVAGGKVFTTTWADPSARVIALDQGTGQLAWSSPLPAGVTQSRPKLAYDGGRLFSVDFDGNVYALDPASGTTIWSTHMHEGVYEGYAFSSEPTATGGVLYVEGHTTGSDTLWALRESDGSTLWLSRIPAGGGDSSPAVDATHVYVDSACAQVVAFDKPSGALAWHHTTDCSGGGGVPPLVYGNRLYDMQRQLALDTATGAETPVWSPRIPLAFSNGVGVVSSEASVSGVRVSDRSVLWTQNLQRFDGEGFAAFPLVVNGIVYTGTTAGQFYALKRDTGELIWTDCLPGPTEAPTDAPTAVWGMGAGNGLLVVPAGRYLVGYESSPDAPSYLCPGPTSWESIGSGGGSTTAPGSGAPGSGAPGAGGTPGAGGGALTLRASRKDLRFGQAVTLSGTAAAGTSVELRADKYPRDAFTPVAHTISGPDGTFRFRIKPDRNAAFRAANGTAESATVVVYTDIAGLVRARRLRGGRTRLVATAVGPHDLPYKGKRLHWYLLRGKPRTMPHLAVSRMRGTRGSFRAVATLKIGFRRSDHFVACIREPHPDAWGRRYPIDTTCGKRRVAALR